MSRANTVRAVAALAVIVVSFLLAINIPPRLGLDLRGGTQLVFETRDSPTVKADAEATDRALEVLRRRVDSLGVTEPTLARSGETRIIVELPGVQDPRQAAEVIGKTAQLTFHPVLGYEEPEATPSATPSPEASPEATAEASPDATPKKGKGPKESPQAEASPAAPGGSSPEGPTPSPQATSQEETQKQDGELVLPDESGMRLRLGPARLTGNGVSDAAAGVDPQTGGGWFVTVDFHTSDGEEWTKLTGEAACYQPGDPRRRVAIVLDGEIISSPQVNESVACNVGLPRDSTQITGSFTPEEAQNLATLIKGGALPVPVEVIEQRTVGPTLGAEAIEASAKAAVAGVILTGLFIIFIYRVVGLMATVALASYGLISYAALVAIGATLTLPGLAGFVLAIGMAVDANVLVFERAREEYVAESRKGLRTALERGFRFAWSAIADSNITTLLAAALLFFLASGPVRGFGVTLSIGVVASLVSAMLITRVLAQWAVNRRSLIKRPKVSGLGGIGRVREWLTRRQPNIMGRRRLWLGLAALAVVVSFAGLGVRGLNFGVEFTGGRLMDYTTSKQISADVAREAVSDAGFPNAVVQSSGDGISVRTGQISGDDQVRIQEALEKVAGEVTKERDELIGPSLGDELRRNALIALAVALAAQLLYLAVRFRWTFGTSAVVALFVDVAVVVGAFAWLGKPIDGVFLAAILTVIGYSVNDKVVVFDRIREAWGLNRRKPFPEVTNTAILQTIPRTVNTGLGAIFILAALAVFGGDSLRDFAIALLIGIVTGTVSSALVAGPMAIELENRSSLPPPQPPAKRVRRPREGTGAVL